MAFITLFDEINSNLVSEFIPNLEKAIDKLKKKERLIIMIDSPGGEIAPAITLYNIISAYKDSLCGLVTGQAVSAAFFVLQAFGKRAAFSNTVLSFHNPHTEQEGDSEMTIEDMAKESGYIKLFRHTIIDIFENSSGMERKDILKLLKSDKLLTPKEAKGKNLLDIVVPAYNGSIFKIGQELQKREKIKKAKKRR